MTVASGPGEEASGIDAAKPRAGASPCGLVAQDLERIFRDCFFARYATVLEGGGPEPLYVPSTEPERRPHRILYREDYFASALHEVAHWCLAGSERRRREDYGYWYRPDGRNAQEQIEFERAEARPQAIEWIFSDACGFAFHLSADNLAGALGPSDRFEDAVRRAKATYLARGLPARAERFRAALVQARASLVQAGAGSPSEPGATSV
ncbi:elongation factor P hydroxylase [Myxococcota bacterium]|nr:elongation factor P hydroxylase [Myxococcota bacterium]